MACTLQQANGRFTSQRLPSAIQRSSIFRPVRLCSLIKLEGRHSFPSSSRHGRVVTLRASTEESVSPAPTVETVSASTAVDSEPEDVFYEGPGSNAELILSLVLMPTLIYAPLSLASIGRRLWISFKFTNKRMSIINTSPLFKRTIEISYANIKEIRTGPRGFGLWGDMVFFLRDGSRIELTGLEKYKEIEEHINRCIYTL